MNDYIQNAIRTEAPINASVESRAFQAMRLLHVTLGLAGEAGEFADQIKKHVFYGTPLDVVNLEEELGDLFWYAAIACDELGVDFNKIQERNIAKLRVRFPHHFTQACAEVRDLATERKALADKLDI